MVTFCSNQLLTTPHNLDPQSYHCVLSAVSLPWWPYLPQLNSNSHLLFSIMLNVLEKEEKKTNHQAKQIVPFTSNDVASVLRIECSVANCIRWWRCVRQKELIAGTLVLMGKEFPEILSFLLDQFFNCFLTNEHLFKANANHKCF